MSTSNPYLRTFSIGAVWFAAVALKMVSRHPGDWSTYPPRNFVVVVVAWIITALLLGVVATRWERWRSWWIIALGTVAGSLVVTGVMLITVEHMRGSSPPPTFKSTDAMMEYLANEASKWVKKDRGLDLDYSIDSIKIIEEELARISKEVDHTNPQQGTFGVAMGYGAYIGEVFRRREGGSWAVDHPTGGQVSYPLTTLSNVTMFPVGWCWKRLTVGEEDNVYHKAMMISQAGNVISNGPAAYPETIQVESKAGPGGAANVSQPIRSETNRTSTPAPRF